MELRHLRYFATLADTLHFGRAAEKLHLSQPALSKQVKELEEELGFLLFYRYKKSIALTEAGKVFLQETQKTLQQAAHAVEQARQVLQGQVGELKIGYESSTLQPLVAPLLTKYRQQWPQVKVLLQEGCTQTALEAVRQETVQLAFVWGPFPTEDFHCRLLGEKHVMVALPAQHPLAREPLVALAQLRDEPFLLHPRHENPMLHHLLLTLCQQAGFAPQVAQELPSQLARLHLVGLGMGVSFALETMQQQVPPNVVLKPLQDEVPPLQVAVVWRRGRLQPHTQHFLQLLPLQQAPT